MIDMHNKIAGTIAGMVYGDAFGVPGELWPREQLKKRFGVINDFLDGPEDNIVACYFKAAHYTDDSSQAFVLLDLLLKYKTIPPVKEIATKLIEWVESLNGFEINLLGPSSKATLLAHKNGDDYSKYTKLSLTNGAAMRIAPVGCFFNYNQTQDLCKTVYGLSKATHDTDVTIAGAAMIAQAVSSGICGRSFEQMIDDVCIAFDYSNAKFGQRTWAASCKQRFLLAVEKAKHTTDDNAFSDFVYEILGTGTLTSESVPAALAIAYYCQDPNKSAHMCANLGGDTDTIGAMATAICGAFKGIDSIDSSRLKTLEQTNNLDFKQLALQIINARSEFEV